MNSIYKKTLLSFASIAVMAMFIHDVKAQTANSNSGSFSGSNANSNSNSSSGSRSSANGGNANAGSSVTFSQPSTTNAYNPTDVTVRSAPTVYVPGVVTGNVCALGASAGASFIGTGFAVGGSWESEQCENRQRAALLHNMGYKVAAKELACDNHATYNAMKRSGEPCIERPEWEPKPAPGQPVVIRPQPVPIQPVQRPVFLASDYATGSECLNAAAAAGAPLSACSGKR